MAAKASAPCQGCGTTVLRTKRTAPIPTHCSDDCRPRCTVDGCERRSESRGLCGSHARRRDRGAPLDELRTITVHKGESCSIDGCERVRVKRDWCEAHYRAWLKHGDPLAGKYKVAPLATECVACGKPEIAPKMRLYCSDACRASARRKPPTHDGKCVKCGAGLGIGRANGKAGRRSNTRFCRDCRGPRRSYRLAVHLLAYYQGPDCAICGEIVDMTLRFPDRRSASVDHRVPLALGGTDDPENLQLAHFACNARRDALFK